MAKTAYYRTAITFALDQKIVLDEIEKRERDGYAPIGVNMRRIYSAKYNRSFIRVSFDFYKQNANQNIREDILVWLYWNDSSFIFHSLEHVHEVPDGID